MKFLFGIASLRTVTLISKSRRGRVSDKHLTESCGLLDKLLPGDVIIADRGFDIQDCVADACPTAQINIPAFTKGKQQLDSLMLKNM